MLAGSDYSVQVWWQGNMAATDLDTLKDLVARVYGKDVCEDLEDGDFQRLRDGKYNSEHRLQNATAASLIASGLDRAIVDVLVSRTSGATFHQSVSPIHAGC